MASGQIDLFSLFGQVADTLKNNKEELNQADTYNHDHGDHMVEIFDVITQAMKEKKNAEPADQLEYAASLLRSKSKSGSGVIYAKGLTQAAKQVSGKSLDAGGMLSMLQTILSGGEQVPSAQGASGDMLGSLLGGLMGGAGSSGQGMDLGSLLGGGAGTSGQGMDLGSLLGGGASGSGDGIGLDDLLGAGMNYMAAKQSGKSDIEALTSAVISGTQMAQSPHRAQSSQLVTSTLLKALTSMMKK